MRQSFTFDEKTLTFTPRKREGEEVDFSDRVEKELKEIKVRVEKEDKGYGNYI